MASRIKSVTIADIFEARFYSGLASLTCSIIMLPRSRRLLVAYGHPCESVFTDFLNPFREREPESLEEIPQEGPDGGRGAAESGGEVSSPEAEASS